MLKIVFLLLKKFFNNINFSAHNKLDLNKVGKDLINLSDCTCETKLCVACDVKNCVHHTPDNMCSAGKIQVGHGEASNSSDTCCDTFRAK